MFVFLCLSPISASRLWDRPPDSKGFIGKGIRLDQVTLRKEDAVADLLSFYMGKNTTERQNFIINNLVVEEDVEEDVE